MGCIPPLASSVNKEEQPETARSSTRRSHPFGIKYSVSDIKITDGLFVQEGDGNPFDYYSKVLVMGEGTFGKVFKVQSRSSRVFRAMKMINKVKLKIKPEEEEKLIKEINILKSLDHPNIMKVYEYFNEPKELYIITELCTGGELFKKITKVKKFKESVAANIMRQLLSVVECCHQKGIIHRDLKPENILIESEEQEKLEYFNIKVIDFGTGEVLQNGKKCVAKIGTPYYIAPEIISDKPYDSKCDLWSCGVILYFLLTGTQPFAGQSDTEVFNNIKNKPITFSKREWKNISENAKDLILKLLERNPLKRYSARKALDHPWIVSNMKKGALEQINKNDINNVLNNIKNFNASKKLQQATLAYIVHNLLDNSKEVLTIRNIFKFLNTNNDGRLTKEELEKGLSYVMEKEEASKETDRVMKAIDADGNGYIEYEEFVRGGIDKKKILTNENLNIVFGIFDKDKSGKISSDELKNILDKEGMFENRVWDKIIKDIDLNGDGVVSFSEFKKMMSLVLN